MGLKTLALLFFVTVASNVFFVLAAKQHVTYGSGVVLRHTDTKFWLFSAPVTWASGSKEQIVTAVDEFDENSMWLIRPKHRPQNHSSRVVLLPIDEGGQYETSATAAGSPVQCGDIIRLEHVGTEKNLHASGHKAGVMRGNLEACGFGAKGVGNEGDDFKLECVRGETLWMLDSPVVLRHVSSNGVLVTSRKAAFTQSNCPRCPIIGHQEVSISLNSSGSADKWAAELGLRLEREDDDEDEHHDKDEL